MQFLFAFYMNSKLLKFDECYCGLKRLTGLEGQEIPNLPYLVIDYGPALFLSKIIKNNR